MSHISPDDDRLLEFLHQHRPDAPPAAADLEQRVMEGIEIIPQQPAKESILPIPRNWLLSGALAASLLIAIGGYRLLAPSTPSVAEKANLEAFLVESWDGVVTGNEIEIYDPEAIFSVSSATNN